MSRLIATLGGRTNALGAQGVCVGYDVAYNNSRIAGVLQSVSDVSGYSGFGAKLIPSGTGTIGYDETHQLHTFTAAQQTILQGPLDGQLALGASGAANNNWWIAWVGTCQTTNYIALLTNANVTRYVGLGINSSGNVFSMTGDQGQTTWANTLVTTSATRRCVIGSVIINTSLTCEVRAQTPVTHAVTEPLTSEPFQLYVGGYPGSLMPAWMTGDMRTLLIGKGTLTTGQRQAIETYATTTDGVHNNASTNA
jgi:hypothetical protein